MPFYEYQCENCCHRFELKQSFKDNSIVTCPKCQGKTRRIFSPVPVHFKGSGFYITDKHESKMPDAKEAKAKASEHGIE